MCGYHAARHTGTGPVQRGGFVARPCLDSTRDSSDTEEEGCRGGRKDGRGESLYTLMRRTGRIEEGRGFRVGGGRTVVYLAHDTVLLFVPRLFVPRPRLLGVVVLFRARCTHTHTRPRGGRGGHEMMSHAQRQAAAGTRTRAHTTLLHRIACREDRYPAHESATASARSRTRSPTRTAARLQSLTRVVIGCAACDPSPQPDTHMSF